jgi:hypothetical protein
MRLLFLLLNSVSGAGHTIPLATLLSFHIVEQWVAKIRLSTKQADSKGVETGKQQRMAWSKTLACGVIQLKRIHWPRVGKILRVCVSEICAKGDFRRCGFDCTANQTKPCDQLAHETWLCHWKTKFES